MEGVLIDGPVVVIPKARKSGGACSTGTVLLVSELGAGDDSFEGAVGVPGLGSESAGEAATGELTLRKFWLQWPWRR